MNSFAFFASNQPMTKMEAHQLIAAAILAIAEKEAYIAPAALVHAEACAVEVGIDQSHRQQFPRNNPEFTDIANAFVNRLIRVGVLERNWAAGGNSIFKLNPEHTETLHAMTTGEGLANVGFVETLNDSVLRARCQMFLITGGKSDTLLREAATVLEDRLRQWVDGSFDRRNLPAKVLHQDTGIKNSIYKDKALQEDFHYLVRGVLGLHGTLVHHSLQEDILAQTATRVVAMIDEILGNLPTKESA